MKQNPTFASRRNPEVKSLN